MLTVKSLNPDKRLAVTIAIFFAEDVLPVWEAEFSEDMRPRKAIEAAKEWLANPCEETVDASRAAAVAAAYAASRAAYATAHAAYATANAATHAATHAATAHAANAANAATHAAYAAATAYAANAAAAATTAAANAAARCSFYVHNKLVQLLPHLFEYKIYTKTSFKDPEQVFDLLSKQNQQRFLFSLNHLR
jgi:hypothetical protein